MTGQPRDFITVVSGLPRSGTSMMMHMLDVGGVPALIDNIRTADEENPTGYFEFEPVKQLRKSASWLDRAYGKVVKVIYLLVYDLPTHHKYKVIFMRRELEEVIASQEVMLRRQGKKEEAGKFDEEQVARVFNRQIEQFDAWIRGRANFDLLYVNYNDVLYNSKSAVDDIERFLHGQLDKEAMMQVVDRSLHRQKRSAAQ